MTRQSRITDVGDITAARIISPEAYRNEGYPFAEWDALREHAPVKYMDEWDIPFWAVTRHEDISYIGQHPELFLNAPLLFINPMLEEPEEFERPATLIEQDNPQHSKNRKLIGKRFTPKALKRIHDDIERIAHSIVDDLLAEGDEGEIDFVERISAPLPIAVIAWLLGVPESDWELIFDWTNKSIGAQDPEFAGEAGPEVGRQALMEMFTYFAGLVEERRKDPKEDLISMFCAAEVDGEALPLIDILAWCQIIMVAGNETTRNATSGGMLALIQHQDQLRKLQAEPALLKSAIEEILRWSSPIIHFARTASQDTELGGQKIKEGQKLAIFFPSANRDTAVFENPYEFRIDRPANQHLAFGVGEHFCAGSHVARLEIEMAFKYLLPRIEEIELTGPPDRLQSNLVGGIKRLPIRYKLRPA